MSHNEVGVMPTEVTDDVYFGAAFDIDKSPIFGFVDNLMSKGQLDPENVDNLKAAMKSLHLGLRQFLDYEKSLGKKVKQLTMDLHQQRLDMDKKGLQQFSDNAEIGELKRELLKTQNEAQLALEREARYQKDIEEATGIKNGLLEDIEEIRRHKANMLEPQLIASTKEIRLEIIQKQHQIESLDRDLEEKRAVYDVVQKEKERLDVEKEKLEVALAEAVEMPAKILKQSEVLRDAITTLIAENAKQSSISQQLEKEVEAIMKKKKQVEDNKTEQANEFEKRRSDIHDLERQCDELFLDQERAKKELTHQKAERVRLEMMMKKLDTEVHREHDKLMKLLNEKENMLKIYRRTETTLANARINIPMQKTQIEEYQRQYEVGKRERQYHEGRIVEIKKEIDLAMYDFLQSEQVEKHEKEQLALVMKANKRLDEQLDVAAKKFNALRRELDSLKIDKELRSRELLKLQSKVRKLREDAELKENNIVSAEKQCQEATNRLKEFASLYEVVKSERNKYMNMIQSTHQRAAEMKEKLRILSSEIEILRNEVTEKEKELTKKRQENSMAYASRDSIKNDSNKLLADYRERRMRIDQNLAKIESLNAFINAAEDDMVSLRKRYEESVETRNKLGVHLLDRNDELCILYEKLNIQQTTMENGERELLEKEEVIRKLNIGIQDLQREVEMRKNLKPKIEATNEQIEKLRVEIAEIREQIVVLSDKVENPNDPSRIRLLEGADPSQNDLVDKIKKVEHALAHKEEKLLEKDLVLEEVALLTERLKKQAAEGKEETNEIAIKLNDLSRKIKNVTNSMMARVSELSMQQALATSLNQEKCEKEALLEISSKRFEIGEAPTDEMEAEIRKSEQRRVQRVKELQRSIERRMAAGSMASGVQVEIDEDHFFIMNDIRTKAEPRPNAYIPDGTFGELPIPKPYGGFAPFKPKETGAQMRHFKKPIIKPIEI